MSDTHVKYPRTYHVPFSPGRSSDDKVLTSLAHFLGKQVVITEKMDGENTSLYRDGLHSRSLDSANHPSRDWVKAFHAGIACGIPEGWRICGENLFARHSLGYESLPSYFLGFSVWNEENVALSWEDTLEFFEDIGIVPVPTLYTGEFPDIQEIARDMDVKTQEGFVVRLQEPFAYEDFHKSVAKWVRAGHVQTDAHWRQQEIVPNRLAK